MSKSTGKSADEIYADAQQLSPDEREKLSLMLGQDTHKVFATPAVEQSWLDEVQRREQLFRDGKSTLIDADQVIREAWQIVEE